MTGLAEPIKLDPSTLRLPDFCPLLRHAVTMEITGAHTTLLKFNKHTMCTAREGTPQIWANFIPAHSEVSTPLSGCNLPIISSPASNHFLFVPFLFRNIQGASWTESVKNRNTNQWSNLPFRCGVFADATLNLKRKKKSENYKIRRWYSFFATVFRWHIKASEW